jgi:hypothetical protein
MVGLGGMVVALGAGFGSVRAVDFDGGAGDCGEKAGSVVRGEFPSKGEVSVVVPFPGDGAGSWFRFGEGSEAEVVGGVGVALGAAQTTDEAFDVGGRGVEGGVE